ncbi:MAG: MerC family mercury resistance protein [Alphaproteobacteria bacterium]|nr:MerC family mercury resistance protein [Alphaproteobacteria bacterium]
MARARHTAWLPRAATVLAILSCYGTTALISILALLGISLAVDQGAWAVAIGFSTALAVLAIAASARHHRRYGPTAAGALGLALVLWVMFGSYAWTIELAGFALLVVAALWDRRLARAPIRARIQLNDGGAVSGRVGAAAGGKASDMSWIEPGDLADRLGREANPMVIDVRGADEFDGPLGHIAAAMNVPVQELAVRLRELDAYRTAPIALVCRTDRRSAAAAALLGDAGFRHVHVLRGGMEAWNRSGLPVERRTPPPSGGNT